VSFHFKLGHGSLASVQFATELLLRQAGDGEELRTLEAIERLAEWQIEQILARDGEELRTLEAIERLAEWQIEQILARDVGEGFSRT
jgi:hypothetical protein